MKTYSIKLKSVHKNPKKTQNLFEQIRKDGQEIDHVQINKSHLVIYTNAITFETSKKTEQSTPSKEPEGDPLVELLQRLSQIPSIQMLRKDPIGESLSDETVRLLSTLNAKFPRFPSLPLEGTFKATFDKAFEEATAALSADTMRSISKEVLAFFEMHRAECALFRDGKICLLESLVKVVHESLLKKAHLNTQ